MVYRHWQREASPLLTCPFKEADHHHLDDDDDGRDDDDHHHDHHYLPVR